MAMTYKFVLIVIVVLAVMSGVFFLVPGAQRDTRVAKNTQSLETSLAQEDVDSGEPFESMNTTALPLSLPEGFSIMHFAAVPEARDIALDPYGNFLVSTRTENKIYIARDMNNDGDALDAGETRVLLDGLNIPHGIATRCDEKCELFIGETNQVSAYEYESDLVPKNKRKIADLPSGRGHNTRSLLFLPDGNLLVSVGSSCNVCVEDDARRAKILIVNPQTGETRPYASGLRNSVFMALHPLTGEVWVTEMGRDRLGDDIPPEEINIIREGKNYGWPYCYDDRVHDRDFDPSGRQKNFCENTEPPHITMQAHSAPLGLAFFPNDWPEEFRSDLLVAYHGSWNRTVPTGYKIVRMKLDETGNKISEEDFLTGFFQNNEAAGRPVDILFDKDSIYITDDHAGAVYRMTPVDRKSIENKKGD